MKATNSKISPSISHYSNAENPFAIDDDDDLDAFLAEEADFLDEGISFDDVSTTSTYQGNSGAVCKEDVIVIDDNADRAKVGGSDRLTVCNVHDFSISIECCFYCH